MAGMDSFPKIYPISVPVGDISVLENILEDMCGQDQKPYAEPD